MLTTSVLEKYRQHLALSADEKVAWGRIKNAARDLGLVLKLEKLEDLDSLTDQQAEDILAKIESRSTARLTSVMDQIAANFPSDND